MSNRRYRVRTSAVDVPQFDLVPVNDELAELALDGALVIILLLLASLPQQEKLLGRNRARNGTIRRGDLA